MTGAPAARLTARQLAVARLLAEGYTRREAARALGCASGTIQAHAQRIARRLPGDERLLRRIVAYLRDVAA